MLTRNNSKIWALLLCSLLFIGLVSCQRNVMVNDMPDLGISFNEYNDHFIITAPLGLNTYKIGDLIGLSIKVIGTNPILFPNDYGVRIFVRNQDQWVEVENAVTDPEGDFLIYPANDDPFMEGSTAIAPMIPEQKKRVMVRIFLVGNIVENGITASDLAVSFIDLYLSR